MVLYQGTTLTRDPGERARWGGRPGTPASVLADVGVVPQKAQNQMGSSVCVSTRAQPYTGLSPAIDARGEGPRGATARFTLAPSPTPRSPRPSMRGERTVKRGGQVHPRPQPHTALSPAIDARGKDRAARQPGSPHSKKRTLFAPEGQTTSSLDSARSTPRRTDLKHQLLLHSRSSIPGPPFPVLTHTLQPPRAVLRALPSIQFFRELQQQDAGPFLQTVYPGAAR